MLTDNQIKEIKEHLDRAQNPLFFFDNDQDGLCSFLLLQRYVGGGKGVPVKSFPDLTVDYFRKVDELKADYIFILDKPVVSEEFWKMVEQVNIPVVWIDHHGIDKETIPKFVNYYNPLFNEKKGSEPVTVLCYQISNRKEDLWLAVIGSISDRFLPDFYSDLRKQYPELTIDSKDAFEIFYKSEIGKIARIFGFALKDRITNVINMQKFLMKADGPYDVLEEKGKNRTMHERFKQVDKKYQKFLEKAVSLRNKHKKLLYFQYGGDMSISSDLANELSYIFQDIIIIVAYVSGTKVNISARGEKVKDIILESIKGFKDATGGGHESAVGAKLMIDDLERFKDKLIKIVEK